jgi:hypothetical protein
MNHFHSQTTIEGLTHNLGMPQQATSIVYTSHLALLYQTLVLPPIPSGLMVKRTLTLAATSKPYTPS